MSASELTSKENFPAIKSSKKSVGPDGVPATAVVTNKGSSTKGRRFKSTAQDTTAEGVISTTDAPKGRHSVNLRDTPTSVSSCTQTCLLFKLIWKLKLRQGKFAFFCEIIFPLILLALLTAGWVYINNYVAKEREDRPGPMERDLVMGNPGRQGFPLKPTPPNGELKTIGEYIYNFRVKPNEQYIGSGLSQDYIHIAPSNAPIARDFIDAMSSIWKDNYSSGNNLKFKFYSSQRKLEDELGLFDDRPALGLILPPSRYDPEQQFLYKIVTSKGVPIPPPSTVRRSCRMGTNRIPACPARAYALSNVLALQSLVEQSIAKLRLRFANNTGTSSSDPKVKLDLTMFTVSSYESPKQRRSSLKRQKGNQGFNDNVFQARLGHTALISSFVLPTSIAMVGLLGSLTVFLVGEKLDKMKEGLRMMGMPISAYWSAWLGVYGLLIGVFWLAFSISTEFLVLLGATTGLFTLLFGLYGLSILSLAFLLSTFFQKPRTAAIAITWLIRAAVASCPLVMWFGYVPKLLPVNLISVYAFMVGATELTKQHLISKRKEGSSGPEELEEFSTPKPEGIYYACGFIAFDIILYSVAAFYLERVIAGDYGARYPPCFCFSPSYWKKSRQAAASEVDTEDPLVAAPGTEEDIEPVSPSMVGKEVIQIRNVYKTYPALLNRNSVTALKGISLDIYEGQITAILGRNGAGKTTLLSILLGLTPPTRGKAIVYGYDTSRPSDMNQVRKIVGPCLQQDLHYPNLTIHEHLEFFGQLRGLSKVQILASSDELLTKLKLDKVKGTFAKDLSGGQKRKLSVALALLGDPPIVLLDEPTAGLDPSSRRNLWDVLRWRKQGKVILLTTHFMDEADILADRKAIIHEGIVRCVGSSLFLKNRFGVGYHLVVELDPRGHRDTSKLDKIIGNSMDHDVLDTKKIVAHTVSYSLPTSSASNFPKVLSEIEQEMKDGGSVRNIGIELTTMEEVFLKIAYTSGFGKDQTEECNLLEQGVQLKPNPFVMLFMLTKLRLLRLIRSPAYIFLIYVVPILVCIIAFRFVANLSPDKEPSPPIIPPDDIKIAMNDTASTREFQDFLKDRKVRIKPFSGEMQDFWKDTEEKYETLGAVSIQDDRSSTNERILKAQISSNGEYVHSQALLFTLVSSYFNRRSGGGGTYRGSMWLPPYAGQDRNADFANAIEFLLGNALVCVLCGIAISFASSGLAIEIIRDKELKTRNHLRLNGVTFWLYYGSLFLAFGVLMLTLIFILFVIIGIHADGEVINVYAMTWAAILIILNVFPQLIFAAIFALKHTKSTGAEVSFAITVLFLGIFAVVFMMALDFGARVIPAFLSYPKLPIHILLSIFNVFYVPGIVFYWIMSEYVFGVVKTGKLPKTSFGFYFTQDILVMLVCTLVQIPLFMLYLYLRDSGICKKEAVKKLFRKQSVASDLGAWSGMEGSNDEDVNDEQRRVTEYFSSSGTYDPTVVVAVKDLWKSYETQTVLHGVSFMVSQSEILGVLGHNGAGKTTTIRIITGEETSDSGQVNMCGHFVNSKQSEAFKQLGFCPQHDALWDNVTLNEHIELYAVLHGISGPDRKRVISDILKGLSIEEHRWKYSQKLSGGTKRKLCYAMSVIGYPRIVIMDEPSTGMDPQSKRYLWNTVLGTFKGSRGAILTTHSMEEADFLCTRIGIMVYGKLVAIGTPQSLKSKFGSGYTLEIKLKPKASDETEEQASVEKNQSKSQSKNISTKSSKKAVTVPADFQFIVENFPGASLLEAFGNRAVFSVPISGIQSVSQAFSTLEKLKESQDIEEYSFSQTTLEQAYLTICRGVEEEE